MTVRKGIPRLGKHRKEPDFETKCPEAAGSVPRRRKLRIIRFRQMAKAHSLRCGSSPHKVCDFAGAPNLLTSNDDIYRRTANCFCKDGIEFGYAVLKNTSPHNYALFMAARDLCDKTEAVTMADLAEPEVIDPEALRLIVNATLIARYGLAAFQIRARGAEYER